MFQNGTDSKGKKSKNSKGTTKNKKTNKKGQQKKGKKGGGTGSELMDKIANHMEKHKEVRCLYPIDSQELFFLSSGFLRDSVDDSAECTESR